MDIDERKSDHIGLTFSSQVDAALRDQRFYYEPAIGIHPREDLQEITFLGKTLRTPIWISSLTGGTKQARIINTNLAKVCHEFGMGMGLGSCRILLENRAHLCDYVEGQINGLKFARAFLQIRDKN